MQKESGCEAACGTVGDKRLPALLSALQSAHAFVPSLVAAARRCVAESQRVGAVVHAVK